MVMLHLASWASLRRELIDSFGIETARTLLMRAGHQAGAADAVLARRARQYGSVREAFMSGPRLHAIQGMVQTEQLRLDVDEECGSVSGEWLWNHSAEVDAHLQSYGTSREPVCWYIVGYASAFSSAFMGKPILMKEVECRAMGARQCRVVAKPAEEWGDNAVDDLNLELDLAAVHNVTDEDDPVLADIRLKQPGDRLVGASSGFVSAIHAINRIATTPAPVLFVGEPGVGKKSMARALHARSNRSDKPFISFNCGTMTGDQLEMELFGAEKTLTGVPRQGLIERAGHGSLFLEDIHELDFRAQAKLLRVICDGEIQRYGSGQSRPSRARILASTNGKLVIATKNGQFREDLFHRIAMFPITVPPLRDRRSDLPLLIRYFARQFSQRYSREVTGLTARALAYISTHPFLGNVAELASMIERAILLAPNGGPLDVTHLASPIDDPTPQFFSVSRHGSLIANDDRSNEEYLNSIVAGLVASGLGIEYLEEQLIIKAIDSAEGNLSKAAKILGLSRPQLAYRHKKLQQRDPE